jgi:hypothetical protein
MLLRAGATTNFDRFEIGNLACMEVLLENGVSAEAAAVVLCRSPIEGNLPVVNALLKKGRRGRNNASLAIVMGLRGGNIGGGQDPFHKQASALPIRAAPIELERPASRAEHAVLLRKGGRSKHGP